MVIASASDRVLIESSFVLTAIVSEVRSAPIPLPPVAISAEFAAILIMFMSIFSAFALTIDSAIITLERFY